MFAAWNKSIWKRKTFIYWYSILFVFVSTFLELFLIFESFLYFFISTYIFLMYIFSILCLHPFIFFVLYLSFDFWFFYYFPLFFLILAGHPQQKKKRKKKRKNTNDSLRASLHSTPHQMVAVMRRFIKAAIRQAKKNKPEVTLIRTFAAARNIIVRLNPVFAHFSLRIHWGLLFAFLSVPQSLFFSP